MITFVTVGSVLAIVMVVCPEKPSVIPSFGVAITDQESPFVVSFDEIVGQVKLVVAVFFSHI